MASGLSLHGSSKEEGVGSLGVLGDEGVEGLEGAACSFDLGSSGLSALETDDVDLWHINDSIVSGHGGDDNNLAITTSKC